MKKLLIIPLLVFLFVGCKDESKLLNIDNNATVNELQPKSIREAEIKSNLPFEDESKLRSLSIEDNNVDFKLSRKAALVEMVEFDELFRKTDPKGDFKLSERPIVVRDANGDAVLYEYIVFGQNYNPIATITNYAKKEASDFTACVLPYVRVYDEKEARLFSAGYPYNGSVKDNTSLRTLMSSNVKATDVSDFWSKASEWGNENQEKSDEDIIKETKTNLRGWFSTDTKWYTIPAFNKENLKRTRFTGPCGPAAMAWVYRGFYDNFKGEYIPLHGEKSNSVFKISPDPNGETSYYDFDSVKNTVFFQKMLKDMGMTVIFEFEGAYNPKKFDEKVSELFPDHMIVTNVSLKGEPRRAIQRGNPVYLVVFAGNGELHYIIGFGTKDKYTWFGIHNDSWLYVTDNGTNTSKHGYLPYYRNSNFFNFSNKYVSMGEFVRKPGR